MSKSIVLVTVAMMLCCLIAGSAFADRLVLIPTANTLGTGGVSAEYATRSNSNDGQAYWINAGVSRFEVEGARFQNFGGNDADAISAQVSVIPETSFTPAIAVGVRDISDETDDKGLLYDGRAFYAVVSKAVPITGGIPILFRDMKVHGGIGTGSLGGVFFGVEGTMPMGLRLSGEYDTHDWNVAASYNILPVLEARASYMKGDFYYGGKFAMKF